MKNIVIRGVEVEENRSRDLVKGGLERTHVEVLGGSGPAAALRETSSVGFSLNLTEYKFVLALLKIDLIQK